MAGPTRDGVIALGQRLARAYEDEELGHMQPHELTAAVKELHVLARRVGIELNDQLHPVATFIDTVADYDYAHATELVEQIRAQEMRDRQMLAEATAQVNQERFDTAASEIVLRDKLLDDPVATEIFRGVAPALGAADSAEEAVELVREMSRQSRANSTSLAHAELRASILGALPPSSTPFGDVPSSQREQAIKMHTIASEDVEADLERTSAGKTQAEVEEWKDDLRASIMGALGPQHDPPQDAE